MEFLVDWRWMVAPFLACLILSITHVYLGIHVVSRKVIFVDLALAQIAALGAIYAVILGYDPHDAEDTLAVALFSLAFTFVGAGIFSISRMRGDRVPQEAFIGIVYAAASAAAVLILSQSPTGGEELREMLVGDILLVPMSTIATDALLYSAIGVFHLVFWRRLFRISVDAEAARRSGINVGIWDLLFYMTFGVLVTRSVDIAGVLLVFSYLVIPAVIAQKWADGIPARLLLGWTTAILASIGGILWSFYSDYPTGPTIVMTLAAFLVLSSAGYYLYRADDRWRAAVNVALMAAFGVAFFWVLGQFEKPPAETALSSLSAGEVLIEALESDQVGGQLEAIDTLQASRESGQSLDDQVLTALTELLVTSESELVVESAVNALSGIREPVALGALREVANRDFDPFLNLTIAEALLASQDTYGYDVLLSILVDEGAGFARALALERLEGDAGEEFGYSMDSAGDQNREALARIEAWMGDLDPG
jgi:zinc/manganese transport system permease protein